MNTVNSSTSFREDQSWLPSIDLYEGPKYYQVVMDVPAVGSDGLRLSRRGTLTHVLAGRTTPWREGAEVVRTGRRYGSFQLLLRVPDAYLCKWTSCVLQKGVLRIRYPRDDEEVDLEVDEVDEVTSQGDSRQPPHGAAAAADEGESESSGGVASAIKVAPAIKGKGALASSGAEEF